MIKTELKLLNNIRFLQNVIVKEKPFKTFFMTTKQLLLSICIGFIFWVGVYFILSANSTPVLDLPEEFHLAQPDDTLIGIYKNDTLFIQFKPKN